MHSVRGNWLGLDQVISRRDFVKIGGSAAAGISLGRLLSSSSAQAEERRHNTSLVCFFMAGGPSDRKSTRLNSSPIPLSRMPSSA